MQPDNDAALLLDPDFADTPSVMPPSVMPNTDHHTLSPQMSADYDSDKYGDRGAVGGRAGSSGDFAADEAASRAFQRWWDNPTPENREALLKAPRPVETAVRRLSPETMAECEARKAAYLAHAANVLPQLVEALEPLAAFIDAFDRKPIRLEDEFYAIHTGTEHEASIRLSQLRAASQALAAAKSVEVPK